MKKGTVTTGFDGKTLNRIAIKVDNLPILIEKGCDNNIDHKPVKAKMSMMTKFAIAIGKKIRLMLTDGKEEKAKSKYGDLIRQRTGAGPTNRLLELNRALLLDDGQGENQSMQVEENFKPKEFVKYTNRNG
jgi:hypothetical protein